MAQLSRNEEWFVPPQVEPRIFANADTDFDLRQRVLAQSNIFGAYATTEPRHDDLGYTYRVELPKREQNRRQREAQRKFVEVELGFVDYLKKYHPSIFDKPAANAPKPAEPQRSE